jgi:hypothetical protein
MRLRLLTCLAAPDERRVTGWLVNCWYYREPEVGTKRTGKGRRKVGRKKRRMRAKIRHRKR